MDLRVEEIFREEMKGDTGFQEKPSMLQLLSGKYNSKHQRELKRTWDMGIKHGIEIGLRRAGLEGQYIDLNNNTINPKHKEFIEKFYKLAEEYKCAIQYHPEYGMTVQDMNMGF